MRKFKVVVVALLALILAVCPALADGEDQLAAIKAKGEIVVATVRARGRRGRTMTSRAIWWASTLRLPRQSPTSWA